MGKVVAAEENYLNAISLYSTLSPQDFSYANCLYFYGVMLKSSDRKAEAIIRIEAALQVYLHNQSPDDVTDCELELQQLRN